MKELKLTRKEYLDGLEKVTEAAQDNTSYLDKFEVTFPDGINTASVLEICRVMQEPSLDAKIHLMRLCIADRNVSVKCPNGEIEKFHISNVDDGLEGFELFQKEPLALVAIADCIYGYILKKSVRLSKAQEAAAATE